MAEDSSGGARRQPAERILVEVIKLNWPHATDAEVQRALNLMIPYYEEVKRLWPGQPDAAAQRDYAKKVVAILGPGVGASRLLRLRWRMAQPARSIRRHQIRQRVNPPELS